MRTSGYKDYRLIENDPYYAKEIKALKIFNKEHLKDIDKIVFGTTNGHSPDRYMSRDEEDIVLGVIQWLGTPVGQKFIEKLQK